MKALVFDVFGTVVDWLDPDAIDASELAALNRAWHRLDAWADAVPGLARLNDEQSALLNTKLVLLLAYQVGDLAVIREALAKAREGVAD